MNEFKRVDEIMQQIVGNENGNHNPVILGEMFNVYNEIFEVKEYSKSCMECRRRVYNNLKQWWVDNGGKKNFIRNGLK